MIQKTVQLAAQSVTVKRGTLRAKNFKTRPPRRHIVEEHNGQKQVSEGK